jgi:putative salt-induced outer membrane protein YdiY
MVSVFQSGLAGLAMVVSTSSAFAEIPPAYRNLLAEADRRDIDDARFLETADMVAVLVPGGRAAVHADVIAHLPSRAGALSEWPLPDPESEAESAPDTDAEPEHAHRSLGGAPVALSGAPEGSGGWLAAPIRALHGELWSGHVRAGVQVENGNSELVDFSLAVELDRQLPHGWRVDNQFEYFLTENGDRTSRDNWLAESRISRALDSGYGYYAGGSYERDLVGAYEQSAFATGGAVWHAIDGDRLGLELRAGVGHRWRERAGDGETLGDWVAEAASDLTFQFSDTSRFESKTTVYGGGGSKIDQRFTLTNRLFGHWAVQTGLHIEHEFETEPGFEPTDTRLDVSLLYGF